MIMIACSKHLENLHRIFPNRPLGAKEFIEDIAAYNEKVDLLFVRKKLNILKKSVG